MTQLPRRAMTFTTLNTMSTRSPLVTINEPPSLADTEEVTLMSVRSDLVTIAGPPSVADTDSVRTEFDQFNEFDDMDLSQVASKPIKQCFQAEC